MSKLQKILIKVLSGRSDANIEFSDITYILECMQFTLRIKGSHYIFSKDGIQEIINIQEGEAGKCKPYQIKQVRSIILKYKLGEFSNE